MNATLDQIKPETIALIEAQTAHSGLSVDDYLRRLISARQESTSEAKAKNQDSALEADAETDDFEKDMIAFAEGTENSPFYKGTYSREDTYFEHD